MQRKADNNNRPAEFDNRVMAYRPMLRKHARLLQGCDAEDLVQDTIVSALERWETFREDGGFSTWLYWKLRGENSNRERKLPRDYGPPEPDFGTMTRRPNSKLETSTNHKLHLKPADSETFAPQQEYIVELEDTLNEVPEKYRTIMKLAAAGYTMKEIGQTVGLSQQRAHQIVSETRKHLLQRTAA